MSRREQLARDLTLEDEASESPLESVQKSGGGLGTFADLKGFQKLIAERKGAVAEQIKPVDPSEVHEPGIEEARAQAIDRINAASAKAEEDLRAVIGSDAGREVPDDLTVREPLTLEHAEEVENDGGEESILLSPTLADRKTLRAVYRGGEDIESTKAEEGRLIGGEDFRIDEPVPKTTDRKTLRENFTTDENIGSNLPKTLDMEVEPLSRTLDMPAVTLTDVSGVESPVKSKATIIDLHEGVVVQEDTGIQEPVVAEYGSVDTIPAEPAKGYEKIYEAPESTEVDVVEEGGTLKGLGIPKDLDLVSGLLTTSGVLALTKLLQKNGISAESWNKINPFDRKRVEKIQKEIDEQEARIEQLKQEKQKIKMRARAEVGYKAPLSKEVQNQMQEKDREIASIEALMLKNRNEQEKILLKPQSEAIGEAPAGSDDIPESQEAKKTGKIEEYLDQAPEPKSSWWKNSPRFRKAATGAGILAGAGLIAGAWLGGKIFKTIFRPFKITEMLGNGVYHFFNFLERSIVKGDPIGALSDAVNGAGKFFDEKMKKAEDWVNKKPEKKS